MTDNVKYECDLGMLKGQTPISEEAISRVADAVRELWPKQC